MGGRGRHADCTNFWSTKVRFTQVYGHDELSFTIDLEEDVLVE